jgi:hypothetical protein
MAFLIHYDEQYEEELANKNEQQKPNESIKCEPVVSAIRYEASIVK